MQDNTQSVKQIAAAAKLYPMLGSKNSKQNRPISTSNLMRPPSRGKTPNQAFGLNNNIEEIDLSENMDQGSIKIINNKKRPNTSKVTRSV